MVMPLRIGEREIGPGRPCFIVGEAGVNHDGDLDRAKRLVDVGMEAGVDAVKFQTFRAERLVSATAPKADYQKQSTDASESQLGMLQRLQLPRGAFHELQAYCNKRGVLFMSTPFDHESANLLDELDVPVFKMGSGELTNLPFLAHVARKGRPIIVSTGMSTMEEVETAVQTMRDAGNSRFALLQCVSNYPASPSDVNLRAMHAMAERFDVPVGYSDHTLGLSVALAAVALGATILEKHFTLDRGLAGPDHQASLDPHDLKALVAGVREVESALGDGCKLPAASELNTASAARRSLVAGADIPAGAVLSEGLIAILRPGTGLPPSMRGQIVGRTAKRDIPAGALLVMEMLE